MLCAGDALDTCGVGWRIEIVGNPVISSVEYGGECSCGDAYARTLVLRPTRECDMKCAGDAVLTCGAGWRTQLYRKNAELVPATTATDKVPSSCATGTETSTSPSTSTITSTSTSMSTGLSTRTTTSKSTSALTAAITSTSTSTSSGSTPTQSASAYGQCGGQNWIGATTCPSGYYYCRYSNQYYSQCVPGSAPATTTTTTSGASSTGSSGSSTNPITQWSQCGGQNWGGSTCCVDGYYCQWISECLSQCIPNQSSSAYYSRCDTKPASTSTSTTATTTTTAAGSTATCSSANSAVARYGQCGGQGWAGGKVCKCLYTCVKSNDYYSQCL